MARPSKNPPLTELLEGMDRVERKMREAEEEKEQLRKKLLLSEIRNYAFIGRLLWDHVKDDLHLTNLVKTVIKETKEHRVFSGWNPTDKPMFSLDDIIDFSVADVQFGSDETEEDDEAPKIDRRRKEHRSIK
ncbi:hypothetical protein [Entomobacter blattae]|uniref:Uncharacterized protein n=1 Tax=Entomobacter blattae TaxID=2762277 RepID=A0A7H1NP76_9PROT|nr:hypothetical protein [Entomobacter blattae]QNT77586.1 hypothetical protein JGUZn3_03290 [Entomobacter blattae]